MLIFSTSLFLFFVAVSEQQDENVKGVLNQTERNLKYNRRANNTKQTIGKINDVPCLDSRSMYDSLGYQGDPMLFAPNSMNQWKPVMPKPVSNEENRILSDRQPSQLKLENIQMLPREQVSQSVPTQLSEKTNGTETVKVPENYSKHITEIVPEPISVLDPDKYKSTAFIPTKVEPHNLPIEEDALQVNTKSNPLFEESSEHIYKYNDADPYYLENSSVKLPGIVQHSNKPTQSIKAKEESTEPYMSERRALYTEDDELPSYKKSPEDIHKHKHNETVPYYFENVTEKLYKIDQKPNKSVQNTKGKQESIEPYNFEEIALSKKYDKLPTSEELSEYILKHNKATKLKLQNKPVKLSYLESKIESRLASEDLPEYIEHKLNEASPDNFGISTEINQKSNKSAQNAKDKDESTEPYISKTKTLSEKDDKLSISEELKEYILKHKKAVKIKHQNKPAQVSYLESKTESSSSGDLPEYIEHKHNEAVPSYFDISTEKYQKSNKPVHSTENKEESTEPSISERRVLSKIDLPASEELHEHNESTKFKLHKQPIPVDYLESQIKTSYSSEKLPHYIINHKELTKIKLSKQPIQVDYLESKTEPNPTYEELPDYILKHKHNDHFETSTTDLPKVDQNLIKPAKSIEDKEESKQPYISERRAFSVKDQKSYNLPQNTKETTEPYTSQSQAPQVLYDIEDKTKNVVKPNINKTMDECSLNKEELTENWLSQESRRSGNGLDVEPLTTANIDVSKNQAKSFKTKESIHEIRQKKLLDKINMDKDEVDDTNRYGAIPLQSNNSPFLKPGILFQPTYYLMDPTKGAGISPLSDPRTLMMESTKVCYACSSLNDASCWFPDRTTTVKYCRPGYDLCVTKIYKSVPTVGMIVIRDCNSACDVNTPGLDTHYDSCAICKEDLCNNLPVENSAFTFSHSNILLFFVIGGIIRSTYF